jgi:hypothetical protein
MWAISSLLASRSTMISLCSHLLPVVFLEAHPSSEKACRAVLKTPPAGAVTSYPPKNARRIWLWSWVDGKSFVIHCHYTMKNVVKPAMGRANRFLAISWWITARSSSNRNPQPSCYGSGAVFYWQSGWSPWRYIKSCIGSCSLLWTNSWRQLMQYPMEF